MIEAFVKHLDLRGYTPIVQDWGGPIGLWVASRDPERVHSLVILNTWAWPVSDDPHFVRFSGMMGGAIGGFAIRHLNAFVNLMIPMGTPRRRLDRVAMNAYRRPLDSPEKRVPSHVFPREIVGSRDFLAEVAESLERLRLHRALIVWGDADIAFRAKERERFEQTFPEHHTLVVERAGHYMQEDAHEEIVAELRSWWRDA